MADQKINLDHGKVDQTQKPFPLYNPNQIALPITLPQSNSKHDKGIPGLRMDLSQPVTDQTHPEQVESRLIKAPIPIHRTDILVHLPRVCHGCQWHWFNGYFGIYYFSSCPAPFYC